MSTESFIGKRVKIVAQDGSNVVIWYGSVTSIDSRFLYLHDKANKNVAISLGQIQKIEEVTYA